MFTKVPFFFLLPALVAGQAYGPPPGPVGPTTTAAPSVPSAPPSTSSQINIDVAFNGNFVYNPNNVTAAVGTLVTFYFPGGTTAHSVTQSTFQNPCTYLTADANNSSSVAGFDSGLVTASTFTLNVTDTQPIWFHCKQLTHCGTGMVGSINAPTTPGNTFQDFQNAAIKLGGNAPTETTGGPVTGGLHAVATAAPSSDAGAGGSPSSSIKVTTSAAVVLLSAIIGFTLV